MMKESLTRLMLTLMIAVGQVCNAAPPESAKIDEILVKSWQKQGLTPNAPATDEIFLRRIYLDIAGRIPTTDEATAFLKSTDPQKRGKLIDELLAGDGYVSNFFNYFADILRLQTDVRGELVGYAYADWLKAALKKNQPFDSMVREMLTTDGAAWDNGAIGFYMRDRGMPLDHLAATVQIFLGTRIECAQCHNHPFDKWTQMDYYKMAAFTYGMDAKRDYTFDTSGMMAGMDRKQLRGPEGKAVREAMQLVRESMKPLVKSLIYTRITETDKLPKLPHDYKYPDAKPGDTIPAKTMYGHEAVAAEGETRLDAFAKWMTSKENARFTTVIANRLWKKVMGMGLIEPVDEMTDSTAPSNAELMTHLEEVMVSKGYNLKSFLRVLFNSQVYQRMPSTKDVMLGESYAFTGPLLRRMSAEQMWDSVVTLLQGNIDDGAANPNQAVEKRLEVLSHLFEKISAQTPQDLLAKAKASGRKVGSPELEARVKVITEQIEAARRKGDRETANNLAKQIKQMRAEHADNAFVIVLGEEAARHFQQDMEGGFKIRTDSMKFVPGTLSQETIMKLKAEGLDERAIKRRMEASIKAATQGDKRTGVITGVARASELPSPAPRGHMLRIFGQSDRETIENASREAAVPQALSMLNGPVAAALIDPGSFFGAQLAKATDGASQTNAIYLGLLSRYPTPQERKVLDQVVAERGDGAKSDIVHALLNTVEFHFVK
jgi:hypothetical protein